MYIYYLGKSHNKVEENNSSMKKIHNLVIILSCYLILGLLTRHNLCKVMLINKQTFDEDLKT